MNDFQHKSRLVTFPLTEVDDLSRGLQFPGPASNAGASCLYPGSAMLYIHLGPEPVCLAQCCDSASRSHPGHHLATPVPDDEMRAALKALHLEHEVRSLAHMVAVSVRFRSVQKLSCMEVFDPQTTAWPKLAERLLSKAVRLEGPSRKQLP